MSGIIQASKPCGRLQPVPGSSQFLVAAQGQRFHAGARAMSRDDARFNTVPDLVSAFELVFPGWTVTRLADTGGLCIKLEKDLRQILVPVADEGGFFYCEHPASILKRYSA